LMAVVNNHTNTQHTMNTKSLRAALKSAIIAEYNGDQITNPAIILEENGEFSFSSSIHGGTVVIDLQEGCGNFSLNNIEPENFNLDLESTLAADQWFIWCADQIAEKINENA
jgi:hypothetical protein